MHNIKKFLLLLVVAAIAVASFASPAYRKPKTIVQSDGSTLTVVLNGDENFNYYTTFDGVPVVRELNGDFSYALLDEDGVFVSTKLIAHNADERGEKELELLSTIDYDDMYEAIGNVAVKRAEARRSAPKRAGSQVSPIGDVNVAVLLVQFQDVKFTYTKEHIDSLLNVEGYVFPNPVALSNGSARDYFMDQSDGKFRPNFLITDIVTLDSAMAYYGANKSGGSDKRASYAIKEGLIKADANFDFSLCDNDGDGEVEFVYCLYAGYSESFGAAPETIWPHKWMLSSSGVGSVTLDGVKCNTYACSGELAYSEDKESKYGKLLAGIGLICHEFSHCLGLPDLYDIRENPKNFGMDYWDIMDYGHYTADTYRPIGYSAYQRDFCGWRGIEVLEEAGEYSLEPLTQGGIAYKVVNDANANEYYILENRCGEAWDYYLFNQGMLITHVDYLKSAWDQNRVNVLENHPRYTLIPADNELLSIVDVDFSNQESKQAYVNSLRGDVWPGTSGNTELTNTSTPASKVYTGGYMNKPITDIKYKNNIISFKFLEDATSIEDVVSADGDVEVYNASGVVVYQGCADTMPKLAAGVYVVVSLEGSSKMFVK